MAFRSNQASRIQIAASGLATQRAPTSTRRHRRPQHTFQLETRPFVLQPFCIAPVLPGETMKLGLLQSRVVTDPIKNQLIGWWKDYYFFYVKHRDLAERDEFESMMLDPAWTMANVDRTTDFVANYTYATATNPVLPWLEKAQRRITEEYFREEGETWNGAGTTLDSQPLMPLGTKRGIYHSAQEEADVTWPDVQISTAGDNAFTLGELDDAQRQYMRLRQEGALQMSYEDFLATYSNVRVAEVEEPHVPELLRYTSQWQYPVSAIDPNDGSAASAVRWQISERLDKDRRFSEPGFIVGITAAYPKVYFRNQRGAAVHLLDRLQDWLPGVLSDDPNSSYKLIPDLHPFISDDYATTGVTDANGWWVDVKDLYLYGDQFLNFALTETDSNIVDLPTADLNKRYVSSADVDAFFAAASPANKIREDGIVTFDIMGTLLDTST